jgi:hypothetical protein
MTKGALGGRNQHSTNRSATIAFQRWFAISLSHFKPFKSVRKLNQPFLQGGWCLNQSCRMLALV